MRDPRSVRLTYKPPYDWAAVIAFLSARATPGVEVVEPHRYRRTITLDGQAGTIEVRRASSRPALMLEVRFPDEGGIPAITDRVRRMFDVATDPAIVSAHLARDRELGARLIRHPGIRTPGAWDPFELAVRAVLGQQVSVRAATTLAGRIAEAFGSAAGYGEDLTRLFPTPTQLAEAPVERSGVMPARAATIRALAGAVAEGRIELNGKSDSAVVSRALMDLPGIGPWTAAYIAMRAYGEPDALPSGDLVLCQATGARTARELEELSQRWRPFRSYAVMLLWQSTMPACNSRPRRAGG